MISFFFDAIGTSKFITLFGLGACASMAMYLGFVAIDIINLKTEKTEKHKFQSSK